jgi:hypothetical protein
MAEIVFDPNEYLRTVASTVPRTAEMFQEGQKAAADIAMSQYQQQAYEQANRFREMQQPYIMASLQREQEKGAEEWRRNQEQYARTQQALGMPFVTPDMRTQSTVQGAGLRPTVETPTGSGAPPGLAQAESGGRTDVINQYGYGGRMQFGQDRLNDAIAAGAAPQGTTVQAFAQNPQLQQQVEAWHFNDINNYIQSQGLGKYVGQTVGGAVVTPQGMLAAAHLGGKAGLKQFLESGGKYNPADQLGTTMGSYMSRFGGVTAPSYVPSMANAPMPGQGYGAPTGLGSIGTSQAGAIPSLQGMPLSTGGVPMTAPGEQQYATGSATTDEYAKYLLGRGLVAAGYDMPGRAAPTPTPSRPMPTGSLLPAQTSGQVQAGNIDLNNRPIVRNADGSISTVRSMSFNENGVEVLIPTVAADGSRILSNQEAIAQYRQTGQHLGKFTTPQAADAYAEQLHKDQEKLYTAPTESIFQRPGLQIGAPQTVGEVNTFELLEPVRIAQSRDIARRKAAYLQNSYERARLTGDVAAMDKVQAEAVNLGTEVELLGRMDALTQFNDGNFAPMAGILSSMTKGRMALEPRTDGKFNIYDGKRKTAEGISREELATQLRMAFDQDFKAKVEEQRKAEIEYRKELGKAGLDIYKETKKQSVQQLRELTNKLAELQFKRDNPRVRLEKTDEGFIEYDDSGSIRAFVTTQPEIGVDGKPVFINPSDPKSGPRYRVLRTPYGAVPTQ